MKRILTTTTALSMALSTMPMSYANAQQTLSTPAGDAICLTDASDACADGTVCFTPSDGTCDSPQAKAEALAAIGAAAAGTAATPDAQAGADAPAAEGDASADAQPATDTGATGDAKAAADASAANEAQPAAAAEDKASAKAAEDAQAATDSQAAADAKSASDAQAAADAKAATDAKAAADAKAATDAQAETDAQAQADGQAAEKTASDTAAKTAADEQAQAEEAARVKAEAGAAAQSDADAAAKADAAIAAQAGADTKASADEKAAADAKAKADAKVTPDAAAAQADAAPTPGPVDETGTAPAADAAAPAVTGQPAQDPAATAGSPEADAPQGDAAASGDAAPTSDATAQPDVATTANTAPPAAPVETPVVPDEAAAALQTLLGEPDTANEPAPAAATASPEPVAGQAPDPAAPVPGAVSTTSTEITANDTRTSGQEFAAAPTAVGNNKKSGLSDLEKFGLVALGGLAVGAILNNGNKVVSNSGDRVVVKEDNGDYRVLKDDDALLRRPGSKLNTQTFDDGSTRTILDRRDGSSIVTIRDASGRVLRRVRYAENGTETRLIDDLQKSPRVDVSKLRAPTYDTTISASDSGDKLSAALDRIRAREDARTYSLGQIRDYRQVRALAPTVAVDNITFASGSAAIDATEAEKLAKLGKLITKLISVRPYEIFLIEGHTDAVGSAPSNLALSDRRAESVALALTEYFDVPPENLVVQGYGESELKVPTEANEPKNRRVAVRLISPLMQTADSR